MEALPLFSFTVVILLAIGCGLILIGHKLPEEADDDE